MKPELSIAYFFENVEEFIFARIFGNCLYPWELLKESKKLLNHLIYETGSDIKCEINKRSTLKGWAQIGENTIIEENVTIEGPVVIGKNCVVKHGALIRPGTIISDNCVIGHASEIKNSLIFSNAKVASLAFVGDSIIGKGARIGSGTVTANRRFDQKNIGLKYEDVYLSFETDFFGCVLGDYSRVGANCTTLPGTLIGPYTWIMPQTRIERFVQKEKIIEVTQEIMIRDNSKYKLYS